MVEELGPNSAIAEEIKSLESNGEFKLLPGHLASIRALRDWCRRIIPKNQEYQPTARSASTSALPDGELYWKWENFCVVSSEEIKVEVKDEELDF